jgi:uncharacterized membrane protein
MKDMLRLGTKDRKKYLIISVVSVLVIALITVSIIAVQLRHNKNEKKKNVENHDNSISESVTKDNSGEKPGNEITTQKVVKKDGNSNVKGRSEKSEKNSATTKEKHEKNANISGKHKKEYGKNDSIKKNSDGIKTYNVDENNQNNKEIKSGSPVKTGDFETRKTIAALMIIQFISIIVIIFMAGKKEKEEQ